MEQTKMIFGHKVLTVQRIFGMLPITYRDFYEVDRKLKIISLLILTLTFLLQSFIIGMFSTVGDAANFVRFFAILGVFGYGSCGIVIGFLLLCEIKNVCRVYNSMLKIAKTLIDFFHVDYCPVKSEEKILLYESVFQTVILILFFVRVKVIKESVYGLGATVASGFFNYAFHSCDVLYSSFLLILSNMLDMANKILLQFKSDLRKPSRSLVFRKFQILRQAFDDLSDISEELNKCFSKPTLVNVTYNFIGIIFTWFSAFFDFRFKNELYVTVIYYNFYIVAKTVETLYFCRVVRLKVIYSIIIIISLIYFCRSVSIEYY